MLSTDITPSPKVAPSEFPRIFRENAPYVWRVLKRFGVRPSDVQDVAQDVFIVVHRNLDRFEGRSSIRTWIYGIAFRVASDYRKSARIRREVIGQDMPEQVTESSADESIDAQRARALLDSMLQELDDDQRFVFVLFEIEQVPMNEIASILNCPLQTAYSRLYAARSWLQSEAARRMKARVKP